MKSQNEPQPKKQQGPGCLLALLMLFIGLFRVPIMWLSEKIRGNGVGFGPAAASFGAATFLMMGMVLLLMGGMIALGYHLWG